MKRIIMGYHPEDGSKTIYYWFYDEAKFTHWQVENKHYAVVETSKGPRLAKIIGTGEINDDERCENIAEREVLRVFDLDE